MTFLIAFLLCAFLVLITVCFVCLADPDHLPLQAIVFLVGLALIACITYLTALGLRSLA